MNNELDVSIVLPCYMEENSIENAVKQIFEVMGKTSYSFELIFVDDASKDKTKEKILKAAFEYPSVHHLLQEKNTGRGKAFINGAEISKGKIIGFLDADMEISPDVLPDVIREIQSGKDVCIVKRNYTIEWSPEFLLRHLASITYKRIAWMLLNIPKLDTETGFKFFRREKLFSLLEKTEAPGWFFDTEIVCLAYYNGMNISQVNGTYKKNWKKNSTVNLFSDSIRQFKSVLAYRKNLKKMFPQ